MGVLFANHAQFYVWYGQVAGIILGMFSANEGRRYIVT